ncbi:rhodanese-like domain-containing protein [Hymenobacter busanensis]|uniref:Rhodanese-like domain-containing protein n=1 Tax=Hymenobacter busanensis TaxID=2607656 RepID=A0A7L4ZV20_9BACT|nr:rhodanese-like domain-containing protein [Hymenobacter busanensis]KAA9339200.1 rhodanese-like domain-containing protein [Hymenobacter busanensis]QHJ07038.1 rhodanese-like domain-containing protein [Hymenobacter busanensis]
MNDITPAELKERQQNQQAPIIIDVREPWEYEESRIDGSRNIPLGELPTKIEDLEDLKHTEVVVHCKGGGRSATAKALLQQHGFDHVRNLVGGINAYNAG